MSSVWCYVPQHNIYIYIYIVFFSEMCVRRACRYLFMVDSVAHLTDPDVLLSLIQQNRSVCMDNNVVPMSGYCISA